MSLNFRSELNDDGAVSTPGHEALAGKQPHAPIPSEQEEQGGHAPCAFEGRGWSVTPWFLLRAGDRSGAEYTSSGYASGQRDRI